MRNKRLGEPEGGVCLVERAWEAAPAVSLGQSRSVPGAKSRGSQGSQVRLPLWGPCPIAYDQLCIPISWESMRRALETAQPLIALEGQMGTCQSFVLKIRAIIK